FPALNHLCDTMRLRWRKDAPPTSGGPAVREAGPWLQFRSVGYYHDRLKEVPNRLLTRWAAVRRQQGLLPLDDLCEIAQLSDAQPLESPDELAGAVLRVDYTHPGEFQWLPPEALRWIMPVEPGPHGRRRLMPPIRARTREAVLQAVHRLEPQVREVLLEYSRY